MQVVLGYVLGLFLLGPVWPLTYRASDRVLPNGQAASLVLFALVPVWAEMALLAVMGCLLPPFLVQVYALVVVLMVGPWLF